ncbi:MAG TPA: glycosyltransferase family 2 protein [Polyangia bacterium]|nr:glycosyltransferase family 2 protein [Polyangia bacterium]
MRTLVIIPAYNEAASLPGVIEGLRRNGHEDLCVIDDGSTDGTAAVAARLGVIVLRNPFNLGIGGAVQTGYLWAAEHGYDAAAQFDGDGQHDPACLRPAIDLIARGHDVVIGSRFLDRGGFRSTFWRRVGIRYLSCLLRLRCGAVVTDPTSGFRVVDRAAIEIFAAHYPSDYPEPEAISLACHRQLRIVEIAVRMRERKFGHSSIAGWGTLYYLVKVSLAILLSAGGARRRATGPA